MGRFNLTHQRLLTGDMGRLYPAGCIEVLPGDIFNHRVGTFIRMSPLAAPVMHSITVRTENYFVPSRLCVPAGTSWENFITGGPDGNPSEQLPTLETSGAAKDLFDYFGLPRKAGITVQAMPIRALNHIFNHWYRDQDLVAERLRNDVTVPVVAWEKDRETTARPAPQKGPEVTLPLGTQAPVRGIGPIDQTYGETNRDVYETGASGTRTYASARATNSGGTMVEQDPNNPGFPGVWADLTNAAAATVNALRQAFAVQTFQENRSRYGSRLTEYLWQSFRVRSPDARLQNPEYLSGSRQTMAVSEVLQTAPDAASPRYGVADMYGHGITAGRGGYRARFLEHGYVITVISVRPKAVYTNGVERMWSRQDRFDFFQPELQFIGQEPMLKKEVFADGTATDDETHGWVDRYSDYAEQRSAVAGEFRDTLAYWHLGRQFNAHQAANSDFVSCNPSKRIFKVQNQDTLWMAVSHSLSASRRVAQVRKGRTI